MLFEPFVGVGFRDDRENFNRVLGNVIEDSQFVADAESVFRSGESLQSLDPAPARLRRSMPQMALERVMNLSAAMRLQLAQIFDGLRRQCDIVSHSGQILASLRRIDNPPSNGVLRHLADQRLSPFAPRG
ncbi:MAG: hypothetical protein WD066_06825 [Planctomycetaceae bacterium]